MMRTVALSAVVNSAWTVCVPNGSGNVHRVVGAASERSSSRPPLKTRRLPSRRPSETPAFMCLVSAEAEVRDVRGAAVRSGRAGLVVEGEEQVRAEQPPEGMAEVRGVAGIGVVAGRYPRLQLRLDEVQESAGSAHGGLVR